MPRATISSEAEENGLKSLPGGFVKLRRMSYGERLHRQDIAMTMSMQQDKAATSRAGGKIEIKQAQTAVGEFEFATCIVDHNLEKDDGSPLNFKNGMDFQLLDGRIGEEISALIEEMHNWETNLPNSAPKSTGSSSAVVIQGATAEGRPTLRTDAWQPSS
jgi:hypothetical protein